MSARTCREVRADLSAYLDGDLDAGLTGETRAHLESCETCRSELELLRLTIGALRRLPDVPPPAAILAGVRARLQPEPWYRRLLGGRPWLLGVPVGALATVLVVVGVSLFQARYPEMRKTVSQGPFPQQPAPQLHAKPTPLAPPAPAAREMGAARQAAPPAPPAPPARDVLRAKGVLGSATLPPGTAGGREVDAPTSSAVVSKTEKSQPAQPEPPVAAPKDAFREESRREDTRAATAAPRAIPKQERVLERTVSLDEPAAARPAGALTPLDRGSGVLDRLTGEAETNSLALENKKESSEVFARKADSGVDLGRARLAAAKTGIEVVCLLRADGDSLHDLELLLRREGAAVEVSALEPPAFREALSRHRGRLGNLSEPSRGWMLTARVQAPAFARLLAVLAGRTGLRILEQPAGPVAPEDPTEPLDLRLTVFR